MQNLCAAFCIAFYLSHMHGPRPKVLGELSFLSCLGVRIKSRLSKDGILSAHVLVQKLLGDLGHQYLKQSSLLGEVWPQKSWWPEATGIRKIVARLRSESLHCRALAQFTEAKNGIQVPKRGLLNTRSSIRFYPNWASSPEVLISPKVHGVHWQGTTLGGRKLEKPEVSQAWGNDSNSSSNHL